MSQSSGIFFLAICVFFVLSQDILVTIPQGQLRGRQEYSLRGISFYAFQQIPYALPPVGELRFKSPQPPAQWEGILDATANTKICYQADDTLEIASLQTEDCLYLNVYTPKFPSTDDALAVMFHIYGGAFIGGASTINMYGPHYLMEEEVIVVSVNYRVGPFGFLATGDEVSPGNYGLKDQLMGLKWVKNNIKYFGGDPDKVTIFGQSAGGASVTYQLMSQQSQGYFRAAIAQSGSFLNPWTYQRDYKKMALMLANATDSSISQSASSQEILSVLRNASAAHIHESGQTISSGYDGLVQGFDYTPVIEPQHADAFLTEEMYSAVENGRMNKVPLMIGLCSEESLFRAADLDTFKQYVYWLDFNVSSLVNLNMHITDQNTLSTVGAAVRNIYTNGSLNDDIGGAIRYFTDTSFTRGLIKHAELQSKFSDVYLYEFSYHGTIGNDNVYVPGAERVSHSEDNYYLWAFGNWSGLNNYPASDILTSDRYRGLFTNFAKYLNPTPAQSDLFNNVIWPKVSPDSLNYLDINDTLTVKTNPKGEVYAKWVALYDQYAVKPLDTY